jgi:hypothetical protein
MLQPGDCSPSRSVVSKMMIGRSWVAVDMIVYRQKGPDFSERKQKNPEAGRASGF